MKLILEPILLQQVFLEGDVPEIACASLAAGRVLSESVRSID
jgi:hypothetical protein